MDELTIEEHIIWHQDPLQQCAGEPIIPQYNFEPLAKVLVGVEEVTKTVEDLILLFFEEAKRYSACGANLNATYAVIRRPPSGWGKLIDKIKALNIETTDEELIPIVIPAPAPVEPDVVTIGCNEAFNFSGTSGIKDIGIDFGEALGSCGIDYDPASIPDRFQIIYDGVVVADSLFRGSESARQSLLDLGYIESELDLGTDPTSGSLRFNKTEALPTTAIIRVTAPLPSTYWNVVGVCPS